jgi:hypothetical protein
MGSSSGRNAYKMMKSEDLRKMLEVKNYKKNNYFN